MQRFNLRGRDQDRKWREMVQDGKDGLMEQMEIR
jgi:hypothetical protein